MKRIYRNNELVLGLVLYKVGRESASLRYTTWHRSCHQRNLCSTGAWPTLVLCSKIHFTEKTV